MRCVASRILRKGLSALAKERSESEAARGDESRPCSWLCYACYALATCRPDPGERVPSLHTIQGMKSEEEGAEASPSIRGLPFPVTYVMAPHGP